VKPDGRVMVGEVVSRWRGGRGDGVASTVAVDPSLAVGVSVPVAVASPVGSGSAVPVAGRDPTVVTGPDRVTEPAGSLTTTGSGAVEEGDAGVV
jgi:hypothetical protein